MMLNEHRIFRTITRTGNINEQAYFHVQRCLAVSLRFREAVSELV